MGMDPPSPAPQSWPWLPHPSVWGLPAAAPWGQWSELRGLTEGDTLFPSLSVGHIALSLNWLLAVPQGSWPWDLARACWVSPLEPRCSPPGCGTRPPLLH